MPVESGGLAAVGENVLTKPRPQGVVMEETK
ncbi:hypothetical protein GGQ63_002511 [Prosthecomicrobium pneumaticum]|uniref:Uncharacterized protein n=1 Tax=Prosthecomicrobium pneumaticum TaxID=81895 RepID=A0A7W9L2F3_9HYPH|nr:hypothetical protein [Prosthecomicrobium pneumaticum]